MRIREIIGGRLKEHYAKICDYASKTLRTNPRNTCKVVVVNLDVRNYFNRLCVCF